jgi:hypothetical protein
LIERRDVGLDDRISRLCDVVRADPVEQVCIRVMARRIGVERAQDDVALLAPRRTTPQGRLRSIHTRVRPGADPVEDQPPVLAFDRQLPLASTGSVRMAGG